MSNIFAEDIEAAKALISEYGETVSWVIVSDSPDSEKPWKDGSTSSTTQSVDIVFLPFEEKNRRELQYIEDTAVPEGMLIGYMGQVDFTPTLKDVVVRSTKNLTVNKIDEYNPNGKGAILYYLELSS